MKFYSESTAQRSSRILGMTLPGASPAFRFLIVGVGMIGREHIQVIRLLGEARVAGIYDPCEESVKSALALFDEVGERKPTAYDSLEAALSAGDADAILICTPNYTHYAIIREASKTGLPLFVEKPMATKLHEAAELVRLGRDYPGFIQLGMQYRFKSQYTDAFREVKALKSLGEVKTISMSEYRPPFLDKVNQWNKFNEYSGGTLVEKCCHYFDLINLMAESRPVSVYGSGGQAVNFLEFSHEGRDADIHDHGFVIINYENGVRASFALNMFSQELYEELIVAGTKGRLLAAEHSSFKREGSRGLIKVEVEGHADYEFRDVSYPELVERSGHHGATFFEHEALIAQLRGQETDSATLEQGLWAILVASAAQESIESQALINVEKFLAAQGLSWVWDESKTLHPDSSK